MRSPQNGAFQLLTRASAIIRLLSWLLLLIGRLDGTPVSNLTRQQLPSDFICTDGSRGHYYMATNESSSDFIVYLQGGPACAHNLTLCAELMLENSNGLFFTSNGFPDYISAYKFLSDDPEENPLYSSYSRVYVPYCTMDMFLLDTEASNGSLAFRGRPFLEQTLISVLEKAANRNSTLVLAGSSAGAVGALNIVNWVLDEFDQVKELSVVLDSASFFYDRTELTQWLDYFSDPAAENITYDKAICLEEFGDGPCCMQLGCMVQRGHYPFSDSRLRGTLAFSSSQDALTEYKIDEIAGLNSKPRLMWDVASHAGRTKSALRNVANVYPEAFSVFSPSCTDQQLLVAAETDMQECLFLNADEEADQETITCEYAENGQLISVAQTGPLDVGLRWRSSKSVEAWDSIQINGISIQSAMERWWEGRGDAFTQISLFDTCNGINCNPSCLSTVLPGSREKVDGLLVWTIVLVTLACAILVLFGGAFLAVWGCFQWKRARKIGAMRAAGRAERTVDPEADAAEASLELSALQQSSRPGLDEDEATPVLEWRSLSYWVLQQEGYFSAWTDDRRPSKYKQLLFTMNGAVPEGALCAVMGPRGCGKSTLFELLAGRTSSGRCDGEVFFEGSSITHQEKDSYKLKSGYIRGNNQSFIDSITVFDNLVFAAMLRWPGTLQDHISRVERVIEATALGRSRNELAGELSPGQKLCMSLALELLNGQRILFIDEPAYDPTATASMEFVTILKRLSKKVTIMVAVRHLRLETLQLFTHALVIENGKTVLCDPIDPSLRHFARHLPDPAPINDMPDKHDDPKGNYPDTRFYSNSSTQHQALSSLHDGGSERVGSELASTVDAAVASARSDFPYSYDLAYGNRSTTSDRYPSRSNDLSNLLEGTMWTSDASRIRKTAKLSGSEPREISHYPTPSGASDVSGVYNARPTTPQFASIPGGIGSGSGSASRERQHRGRFSETESEFSTHVDVCMESNASTLACGVPRTPRDATRDFDEMGRRYRGGRDGVVEAKDSTDGSSFSPSFSSSSTNAVDVVEDVTDGSRKRQRRKGRRRGVATSASVSGERKLEVQKGRVGDGAWGGSHPGDSDRNRGGSGKGDRTTDHHTGIRDTKEFHTEPGRIGVSDQAVGGDKLPAKIVSHRSFSERIPGTTGIIDHYLLARVHAAAAAERSRMSRNQQQGTKKWKLARMPTPVPPQFASDETGKQDEHRSRGDRQTSGKGVEGLGSDLNHQSGFTGDAPWDGGGEERQKVAPWKVTAILMARSCMSGYAREIMWRFVALEVATVFAAAMFLARNWREWGEFYMSFSVLLTMIMPVLVVYHPVMIVNMRESWLLMQTEIADGLYSPMCGIMRVVFDYLATGVFGSFSTVGIMHVLVWRRFTSGLPVSTVGVHVQLCCVVTLVGWAMIALFGSLGTSRIRLTTTLSMGTCLCAGWAFFSGVIVSLPSLLPVLRALTITSPFYWGSSFALRVMLDGLDRSDRCSIRRLLGCALRYGDVVADDLGLHIHPPGTFLVVTGLFVILGLGLLSTMIVVKSGRTGILISSSVRSKRRDGRNAVRGVKAARGDKAIGAARSVVKREIQTNREQHVYRDEEERYSLRKMRWPKLLSNAVINHFPGSGTVPDTLGTAPPPPAVVAAAAAAAAAAAEVEVVDSASSSSFSFESCSPPSSLVSPYGGESPVPLLPSVAATRITADALARFEKSAPPLSFNRGAGNWTSSRKGLPADMTGSVDEPTPSVPPLQSTAISSSNASSNAARTRSRSSAKAKGIMMDMVKGPPPHLHLHQTMKTREFVVPNEHEQTNYSGAPGRGIMSDDKSDLATLGTVAATSRMMAMSTATSLFSDRCVVRGEDPHRQPHEVHFSLQQSSQVRGHGDERKWAPVRGRPPTPKHHGKQRSRPERREVAARKHPRSEQVLRTPQFTHDGNERHQTTVDESPPAMVPRLRPHDDGSYEGDAMGLIMNVIGVGAMGESHEAGYFGSSLAGVSPPSE